MLSFLLPKTKVRYYETRRVPIEDFEVIGIGQINPYCQNRFDNEIFVTAVNIAERTREYDEKEGLVLSDYFTVRKCPKCHSIKLIPTKIRINSLKKYPNVRYYGGYGAPDMIYAYCNSCSSCFEFEIKEDDLWLKEAGKIKEKNLITGSWERYCTEPVR